MNYHIFNKKLIYLVALGFSLQISAMNWLPSREQLGQVIPSREAISAGLAQLKSRLPSSSSIINLIPSSVKNRFSGVDWEIVIPIATSLFFIVTSIATSKYLIPTYEETTSGLYKPKMPERTIALPTFPSTAKKDTPGTVSDKKEIMPSHSAFPILSIAPVSGPVRSKIGSSISSEEIEKLISDYIKQISSLKDSAKTEYQSTSVNFIAQKLDLALQSYLATKDLIDLKRSIVDLVNDIEEQKRKLSEIEEVPTDYEETPNAKIFFLDHIAKMLLYPLQEQLFKYTHIHSTLNEIAHLADRAGKMELTPQNITILQQMHGQLEQAFKELPALRSSTEPEHYRRTLGKLQYAQRHIQNQLAKHQRR